MVKIIRHIKVHLSNNDIVNIPCDALITALHRRDWMVRHTHWPQIMESVSRISDDRFYEALRSHTRRTGNIRPGDTIFIKGNGKDGVKHRGKFGGVIFVGDNHSTDLSFIVHKALVEATEQKLTSVSLPLMRMGFAEEVMKCDAEYVVNEITDGIETFFYDNPGSSITDIHFSTFMNPEGYDLLKQRYRKRITLYGDAGKKQRKEAV